MPKIKIKNEYTIHNMYSVYVYDLTIRPSISGHFGGTAKEAF